MITIEQIRAARALLDWSQGELAERAGLSQTGIARIEGGSQTPTVTTLEKIEKAFDLEGIEFMQGGLRMRDNSVLRLQGGENLKWLYNDIYEKVEEGNCEIRVYNGLPSEIIEHLGHDFIEMHRDRMTKSLDKFISRTVVKWGNRNLFGSDYSEYRWLPEEDFVDLMVYIYNDYVAFIDFNQGVHIELHRNPLIAKTQSNFFDIAWDSKAIAIN